MDNHVAYDQLIASVSAWDRRRRLAEAAWAVPRGLLVGLILGAAFAVAARFQPVATNAEVGLVALGLALAGAILAAALLFALRRDTLAQARFADRQFALQERMSTAVELGAGTLEAPASLVERQLLDALSAAKTVNTQRQLPARFRASDLALIGVSLLLLGLAVVLPNPKTEQLAEQRQIRQAIRAQVSVVQSLANELADNDALTAEQRAELSAPLEDALAALDGDNLNQEQAVAVLSEAEAELRSLARGLAQPELREALQAAGAALETNPGTADLADSLASGDLGGAAAAMNRLADGLGALDPLAAAKLGQQLAAAASALSQVDPELAQSLSDAAQALEEGDPAGAEAAMRDAAGTLQERRQELAAADQAQAAADALAEARAEVAGAGSSGETAGGAPADSNGEVQGSSGGQSSDDQGLSNGGTETGAPSGSPAAGGGHVEGVYVPLPTDLSDQEGQAVELDAQCRVNPDACGPLVDESPAPFRDETSVVPYDQVFGQYRDAANSALEGDYVPQSLKSLVRDYFTALEP